ncbi:hypothetical protein QFC22_006249 [Naganishia vaughanmartiniae]|uniref:Uncharacterized protein n=1 Tax=Naganishia vaughanmartiniae TaxID=1424756 RepID=A0ACC2WPP2_9TREE|nr:hypothetical protein QFC22_006249 [Naganishia vaughanmartiniae]
MNMQTVLLTIPVSRSSLDALNEQFRKIVYCPPSPPSGTSSTDNQTDHGRAIQEALPGVQVLIASAKHLALLSCENTEEWNRLRLVQLASAGVDTALETGWMKRLVESGRVVKTQGEWLDRQRRLEVVERRDKAEEDGNGSSAGES